MKYEPRVLVHGGAGAVEPERRAGHLDGCREAALLGASVLGDGGTGIEAAEAAVRFLEDHPLYNAGTGGCLNREGKLEFDAALMCGESARYGAVACLSTFRHPISVARRLSEVDGLAFLAGTGADIFAQSEGFEPVPEEEMVTPLARERLARFLRGEVGRGWAGGTVGAVVSDGRGSVVAATSTGGTVGKAVGRVGDSPLPGCGTWADASSGACSATGIGEDILRVGLARGACDFLKSGSLPDDAARAAIEEMEARVNGSGGLILIDPYGRWGAHFNTEMMSFAIAAPGVLVASGQ